MKNPPTARMRALHGAPLTLMDLCQPCGGLNARDQRVGSWEQSVKRHERLSADTPVRINVKSQIGITGGAVVGARHMKPKRARMNDRPAANPTPARKPRWAK